MDNFRIAVFLNGGKFLSWQANTIEKISESNMADLIIVTNDIKLISKVPGVLGFLRKIEKRLFWRKIIYDKEIAIVDFLDKLKFTNPGLKISLTQLDKFQADFEMGIDLVVDFTNKFHEIFKGINFKYGILNYKTMASWVNPETMDCYWETVKQMDEIEIVISLKGMFWEEEKIIFRTGIIPYPNSVYVNVNNVYELAAVLMPRVIFGIATLGKEYVDDLVKHYESKELPPKKRFPAFPNIFIVIVNLLKITYGYVFTRFGKPKFKNWFLLVRRKVDNIFESYSTDGFVKLIPSRDTFWADPFLVSVPPFHYIFVEEYVYYTVKAHISVLKLDDKLKLVENKKILDKPYHLSYPNVFYCQDAYYMVPESGDNKTIEIYKCFDFPEKWDFFMTLMEGIDAKDTTLFFHNNKWWLFTSIILYKSSVFSYSELFLFYSDQLFTSNWKQHPLNPVVSDHKSSRSAGCIFISENKIIRPSQDCSKEYGRAINFNQITKLSETEYEEIVLSKIESDEELTFRGAHTYNCNSNIEIIDAYK